MGVIFLLQLGFDIGVSGDDVAVIYNGTKDYTAKGGPIWINFETSPCNGDEKDITECQVNITIIFCNYNWKLNMR